MLTLRDHNRLKDSMRQVFFVKLNFLSTITKWQIFIKGKGGEKDFKRYNIIGSNTLPGMSTFSYVWRLHSAATELLTLSGV